MYETSSTKEKLLLFSKLLIPVLITQVSMYLMNFIDTVMSGRAGAEDLAGVAIGSSLWLPVFTGVNGILIAITPIIAQLTGAKATKNIPKKVQQAIYISIVLAFGILIIGFFILDPILQQMDLEQSVRHVAKYYLIALVSGIFPLFIFNTLRSFVDALGKTRVSMVVILIALPLNLLLNYIFIFGKFGIPAFGGIGAGIATAITYWFICLIILGIIHQVHPFRNYNILSNWTAPSLITWWEQLKIGVPVGISIFFETSIFSAVTLFMSVYSTYTIAAHQAAMNFSSLFYMIPLSVGLTLTIAVGFEVGGKRLIDARTYGYMGMAGGVIIALFAGVILYVFDHQIATLYSTDPNVIRLIKQFIIYAIFFQLADAFGAPIQGALRGYKDVNITLIISLISYWGIGLPSGWLLANFTSLEPFGYWVGLIIGLSTGAIALVGRLLYLQKQYQRTKFEQTS